MSNDVIPAMDEKTIFQHLLKHIEAYSSNQRSGKYLDYQSPEELTKILDLDRAAPTGDWREIFNWVGKYLDYSVKTHHPAFVNRMWVGANLPSVVGEIVAAVSNVSADTYESAPVSTLMEKYMIQQMLDVVGFENGEGQMTTGSSNANMIAMMMARNLAGDSVKKTGLFGQKKLFAFVGADSHYSMDKAANILGLGTTQLVKVPLNRMGEMEPEALETAIERVKVNGGQPFFVSSTAGTTVRGAYDPIESLLPLREKYGFWLHVDGAWGGAAVLSQSLKDKYLKGLGAANSFTVDFHKMLGASLMCNVLLINDSDHMLGTVLSGGDGSYLFRDEHNNEVEDLGAVSLQCGRRVDSLKWFLDWKFYGHRGLGDRVEKNLELCRYAEEWVVQSEELEMVAPRNSFNICFRFKVAEEESSSFNITLRDHLYREEICLVGGAYINGSFIMRLLICNPLAERADIDTFFENVVKAGRRLLAERGS